MKKDKSDLNLDLEDVESFSNEGKFIKSLKEVVGLENCLILNFRTARDLLTDKNIEVIKELKNSEPKSSSELANKLGRDEEELKKELRKLYKYSVIDFVEENNNKKSKLRHKNIAIKPLEI